MAETATTASQAMTLRDATPADDEECARICFEAFGGIHDFHKFRALGVVPRERKAIAPREVEHPRCGFGRARAHDLETDPLDPLQSFAPGDERREHEVAERPVLE
jgi:hypothetical protein